MTKSELFELYVGLKSITNLKGVKFNHAIARNINKIEPEIKALQKSLEASDEFNEYEKKRVELAKEHAKKVDGEPLLENNRYIMEDKEAFDKAFEEFKLDYTEVIEAREKQAEDYNELLEEDTDIELYKIDLENIPE